MENPIWINKIQLTAYEDDSLYVYMQGTYDHYDREYNWMAKTLCKEEVIALRDYLNAYFPPETETSGTGQTQDVPTP